MEKKIKKIKANQTIRAKKRVCAYARVSSGKDSMLHSLSYQVSYYSKFIQANNEWLYIGVYSDEGISGTKVAKRVQFLKMMEDCRSGLIELIITKSVSNEVIFYFVSR